MKIETFVIKTASLCNLNCTYCHMYNMGDNSYKQQPKFISKETITSFSYALNRYTLKYKINHVFLAFHGGEPLLMDIAYFEDCLRIIKNINPHIQITLLMQTNGVLLSSKWAKLLKENDINVGISLDGDKKRNDEFRVFHNGKGSYDEVINSVRTVDEYNIVKGVISVVDIESDSYEFYYHMKSINNQQLNLLLPNVNYSNIPQYYLPFDKYKENVSEWLIQVYEIWKNDTERVNIPFYEIIIKLIFGYNNFGNQLVGNCENGVAVLETNGDIEVIDALRTCYENATRSKLNISNIEIDAIHENELFQKYYYSHTLHLPTKCKECEIKDICGGGFLPHRYNEHNNKFDNPSIYCDVLIKLISHIKNDLV